MSIATDTRHIIAGLLITGITLLALPLSVFSQEIIEDGSVPEPVEIQEQTPAEQGWSLETITTFGIEGDFVVGPGKTEIEINPGESYTVELTVTNRMGERHRFDLSVEDATGSQNPDESITLLGDDIGPYTLRDYITFPVDSVELEHGQRARIPVTVSLPEDAEPGGRYGSVIVDTVAVKAEPGSSTGAAPQSAIITRIGTLFFITTPGDIEVEGELVKFATIPDKNFFQRGPIKFELLYENTGSIHLNPYGEIRITNMLGEEIGFLELDPWFALPGSLRLREREWNRDFLFGKYTAVANINRGYEDVVDTKTLTFWVLPWMPILGAFLIIFVVIYLIRAFFRTFEFKKKSS